MRETPTTGDAPSSPVTQRPESPDAQDTASNGPVGPGRAICVLGMHRSGTSLVASILNALGVDLGPAEHLMPAGENNPKGYGEHKKIVRVNNEILWTLGGRWDDPPRFPVGWEGDPQLAGARARAHGWIREDFATARVWGWKDPRTCLTLPFWQRLVSPLSCVICLRNPVAVARSLARRDGMTMERASWLWDYYVRAAIRNTQGLPRLFVAYEDLLVEPQRQMTRLIEFCGLERPADLRDVCGVIDPSLSHHAGGMAALLREERIAARHKVFYLGLCALSGGGLESSGTSGRRDGQIAEDVGRLSRLVERLHDPPQAADPEVGTRSRRVAEHRRPLTALEGSLRWLASRCRRVVGRLLPLRGRRRARRGFSTKPVRASARSERP